MKTWLTILIGVPNLNTLENLGNMKTLEKNLHKMTNMSMSELERNTGMDNTEHLNNMHMNTLNMESLQAMQSNHSNSNLIFSDTSIPNPPHLHNIQNMQNMQNMQNIHMQNMEMAFQSGIRNLNGSSATNNGFNPIGVSHINKTASVLSSSLPSQIDNIDLPPISLSRTHQNSAFPLRPPLHNDREDKSSNEYKEEISQYRHDKKAKGKRRSKNDIEGRIFKCSHCDKTYLSYPALYTHIKTKHSNQNDGNTPSLHNGRGRGRPKKFVRVFLF